ncbi:hypothetical protein JCM17961_43630 [Endothiovibrio diazotrophicus]
MIPYSAAMSFRTRLILLVTGLLTAAVVATTALLTWTTTRSLLRETKADGEMVAMLLARSAALARRIPGEVESALSEQMVAEALITAHFVAAAEKAGIPPGEINLRLGEIADRTVLDEFWITDAKGHVYLQNIPGVDFTFSPDAAEQPQASRFWPLLTGDKRRVVQEVRKREIDQRHFKYVGVAGVDHPRIVEVGFDAHYLKELEERVGVPRMVEQLLSGNEINAIWVFDDKLDTIAAASIFGVERNPRPNDEEQTLLAAVAADGHSQARLLDRWLSVAAPVLAEDGQPIGMALVRLSTEGLERTRRAQLESAALVAVGVLLLGLLVSIWTARRESAPVLAITRAAREVEHRNFQAELLAPLTLRRDELGRLARVFTRMAEEVLAREEYLDAQVKERTRQLEKAHQRIDEELRVAGALQNAILPCVFPDRPDYAIHASMTAAREVGGDFYDFFPVDERRVAVVIGDVSGKGVPASFFMAVSRTTLQGLAEDGTPPGEVLAEANATLCRENPLDLFVTVFCAILDTASGELTYANGGHNPPYHLGAEGGVAALPLTGGVALGVVDGLPYAETRITLAPGDGLFLFTDGITEAFDADGHEFGEVRLIEQLTGAAALDARALVERITGAVAAFTGEAEQSDDLTCLALRYRGGGPATEPGSNA